MCEAKCHATSKIDIWFWEHKGTQTSQKLVAKEKVPLAEEGANMARLFMRRWRTRSCGGRR